MKAILAIIATLISGIGGHFVNRRWDRALFFFGLAVIWIVATSAYSMLTGTSHRGISFGPDLNLTSLPILGFLLIWGLSLIVTFYDAIKPNVVHQHNWTIQGRVGATLFSLILIAPLGLFGWGMFTSLWLKHEFNDPSGFERSSYSSSHFSKYIYLGSSDIAMHSLPEPPTGNRYLSGQFLLDDEPAEGIQLSVILNNKYKAKNLETDSNGLFLIEVEAQDWFVNLVIVEGWEGAPKGADHFVVVKPNEPKYISGERYLDSIFDRNKNGVSVKATEKPGVSPLTLVIKKNVQIHWPRSGKEALVASVDDDVISWNAVNNVSRYLLEISRIERNGSPVPEFTQSLRRRLLGPAPFLCLILLLPM